MHKHYSLAHAEKVLKFARKFYKGKRDDVTIEVWANCREQGFHLVNYTKKKALSFAQQRNSDETVVVYGDPQDFDITTNAPTDEAWDKRRMHFRESQDEEAGRWIAAYVS